MAWTELDVDKFNKGLSTKQKRLWVSVANGILKTYAGTKGCEEKAIKIANSKFAFNPVLKGIKLDLLEKKFKTDSNSSGGVLYIVRHGKTALNSPTNSLEGDKIRGWQDIPLDKEGIQQAVDLANNFKGMKVDEIYSSNLSRASVTAQKIAQAIGGLKVTSLKDLRPWNLGKYQGMSSAKAFPNIKRFFENPDQVVPEGESFNSFAGRYLDFLRSVMKKVESGKKIIIVTHYRNVQLTHAWFKAGANGNKFDEKEFLRHNKKNGTATVDKIEKKKGKWSLSDSSIGKNMSRKAKDECLIIPIVPGISFVVQQGRPVRRFQEASQGRSGVTVNLAEQSTTVQDRGMATGNRGMHHITQQGENEGNHMEEKRFQYLTELSADKDGHTHQAAIDEDGNGATTFSHGHQHLIRDFSVLSAKDESGKQISSHDDIPSDGTVTTEMEIFRTGTHNGDEFSEDDLEKIAQNFHSLKNEVRPKLKITHRENQESLAGLASYGDIVDVFMKRVEDGSRRLFARVSNIPGQVIKLIRERRFPERSIEIYPKFKLGTKDDSPTYENVLKAIALLGHEMPAVTGMAPILMEECLECQGTNCFVQKFVNKRQVEGDDITGLGQPPDVKDEDDDQQIQCPSCGNMIDIDDDSFDNTGYVQCQACYRRITPEDMEVPPKKPSNAAAEAMSADMENLSFSMNTEKELLKREGGD